MEQYEIYWSDLTEEAQERLKGMYHDNIEMSPLAIVDIEPEEPGEGDIQFKRSKGSRQR